MDFTPPDIVRSGVLVSTQGEYLTNTGQPKGLVVHYSAGQFSKGGVSARRTLNYMATQGLGCFVMDTDGKLYRAENQQINQVAYHAGKSEWQGINRLSYYLMGIEICCAGKIEGDGKSWFGEIIPENQRRIVYDQDGNRRPGTYHAFTTLQETALINFCLWQLNTNPEFDVDWIVGHDEIAPNRKTDPGGSLSMSMPDFRVMIGNLYGHRGSA